MPRAESDPLLGNTEPQSPSSIKLLESTRIYARRCLGSRWGHYLVILLVTIDVGCIFADFMINLHLCERKCSQDSEQDESFLKALEALEVISLVISCLFLAELLANFFAFGLGYLKSWFHCLDATVILAGFILDVCLKGVVQEVGSTIVILRLWRVIQILDEFSAGASERMEGLCEQIEDLASENRQLMEEVAILQAEQREH